MLPLKDFNPTRRRAGVTLVLIVACVVTFLLVQPVDTDQVIASSANRFTYSTAAIPDEIVTGQPLTVREVAGSNPRAAASCDGVTARRTGDRVVLEGDPDRPCFPGKNVRLAVVTSLFLHGSLGHLVFNMWFLWLFGNNIEDRFGRLRYLLFYLAAGVAATLAYVLTAPSSPVPLVGASGAIAGVMGAYLVLYPNVQILGLLGIFPLPLRAKWFLLFWLGAQFLGQDSGVAYAAHIGGFLFGMAVGGVVRSASPSRPPSPPWAPGLQRY